MSFAFDVDLSSSPVLATSPLGFNEVAALSALLRLEPLSRRGGGGRGGWDCFPDEVEGVRDGSGWLAGSSPPYSEPEVAGSGPFCSEVSEGGVIIRS